MRVRVLRLLLFVLALALPVLGWAVQQLFSEQLPPPSPNLAAIEIPAPTVSAERLLVDVEALSFERYTDGDRQRARDYITQSLADVGWTVETHPFEGGVNLYADRPGTAPEAGTVLVGAHYDSVERSPGADDNATGVTALLEIARLLGDVPTPQTLRLAFFDLEEQGLVGSAAFVAEETLTQNLTGAVILEMLGYACNEPGCQQYPPMLPLTPPTDRGDFLAALGDRDHAFLLDAFQATADENSPDVLSLAVPVVAGIAPDLIRSDHAPFWQQGIGAVLLTDTANFRTPHYHQPTDTSATLTPSFFVQSTQIVVNGLMRLLQ